MKYEFEKLLSAVSAISKKYENIAEISGENFNVFTLLKLSTREVRTHSAFLAELLNPKGSHGHGAIFLKLFIEETKNYLIEEKDDVEEKAFLIDEFDSENAIVQVEKHIGKISDDRTEGGYIDIIANDIKSNQAIIIENKINAGDQENQLLRYFKYGYKETQGFVLYYLTLDGKEATDWSLGELNTKDYTCISYQKHIKFWLEKCKEKAVNYPLLRETIAQYILLIKQLTGQTMSDTEKQEVIKIIIDNYEASRAIKESFNSAVFNVVNGVIKEVVASVEIELGKDWAIDKNYNLDNPFSGPTFRYKKWPHGVLIKLEGQSKIPWNSSVLGIVAQRNEIDREEIINLFSEVSYLEKYNENNDKWPYYKTLFNLQDEKEKTKLFVDTTKKIFVENIAYEICQIANTCKEPLSKFKHR